MKTIGEKGALTIRKRHRKCPKLRTDSLLKTTIKGKMKEKEEDQCKTDVILDWTLTDCRRWRLKEEREEWRRWTFKPDKEIENQK